jgi:hypothetical protein
MSTAVVTVASGGLPVVELAAGKLGLPVTEATNGRGIAVTKVVGMPGLPVVFDTIGVLPPVTYATWDAATATAVTLSGGNLVATNTGTTSPDQGAKVASAASKTSGKYYFEMTVNAKTGAGNGGFGIGTTASTYTTIGSSSTVGTIIYWQPGNIWANGSYTGSSLTAIPNGGIVGVAVDLDNRRVWFRVTPSSNWNGSGTANPATNTGGIVVPAGTMVPFVTFGGTLGVANNIITANFGASAFNGAVPAGFTSGWPA